MIRAAPVFRFRFRSLFAALLGLALMLAGVGPVLAQSDGLRPPGRVPQGRPVPPAAPSGGGGGLFGGWFPFLPQMQPRPQAPQAPPPVVQPPPVVKQPPAEPEGTVYATADEAVQGKRQPPTKFVLVLGDRVAGQLAKGLADGYVTEKNSPAVIGRFDDESGFLPGDGIDWLARSPDAVAAGRPNAVILALGSNDLQPIRDGSQTVEPLTERWNELYGRRVVDILTGLRIRARNVILVGPPPVQAPDLFANYERLNEVLAEFARRAGVAYVNVWDGFVDEDGKFAAFGAAVDGQRRRLRFNDGVRFTRAGARKLAFFTGKDLTRLLAEPVPTPGAGGLDGPISLSTPPRSGGMLLGEERPAGPRPVEGTPGQAPSPAAAHRILTEGAVVPAVAGRADDFAWPPRPPATPASAASSTPPADPPSAPADP